MVDIVKKIYAVIDAKNPILTKIFRYIISGGTAAVVDLSLLYLFTDIFGIWYLFSAVGAFLVAFLVSFNLQKYWTFKDGSKDRIKTQAAGYFLITAINLGLNTLGIFLLVHYGKIHYLPAQFIVSALIAVESYFIYHFVFIDRPPVSR